MGTVASRVAFSPCHFPSSISTLESSRGGSVGILMYHSMSALLYHSMSALLYHSMSALLHLGKSTAHGGLGWNAFNHPLTYQVSYVVLPPPTLILSYFQVSCKTCHRPIQTFDSNGIMLDGGSLASHSS